MTVNLVVDLLNYVVADLPISNLVANYNTKRLKQEINIVVDQEIDNNWLIIKKLWLIVKTLWLIS